MFNYFGLTASLPPLGPQFIINAIILVCVFLVLLAILIDFTEFHLKPNFKKQKKSIVETGTMFMFFLLFYYFIRFNVGWLEITNDSLRIITVGLGLTILILGCIINIIGRLSLKDNWSNQIKIYQDHSLVISGVYGYFRHPLYASLIMMFFGASLVYSNWLSGIATLVIFIPFMYYRAKQEEYLLANEFSNYSNYQKKVGMFFPKSIKKYDKI